MSKHSEACCQLPPVISQGYKTKGEYKTINDLRTYVTGPSQATQAILMVYDIFGFQDQILQGADILAHSDNGHQYQVFMPDFFEGDSIDLSEYPPQTDEQKKKLGAFFSSTANPEKAQSQIYACIKAVEQINPFIKKWAGLGFCWGGKMISLASGPGSPFKAAAQSSPAMVDPRDAAKISIPMCVLASKDEPAQEVRQYEQNLKGVKHVEIYDTQLHGFMSARGNLKDEAVLKEYERGYKTLLTFFHENL